MPVGLKLLVLFAALASLGAKHETVNFVIEASTPELARQVGDAAEHHRRQLAVSWLGQPLKSWFHKCKVTVRDGANLGAGGRTKFKFDRGDVYGWDMHVQGSVERILDSVIPHEVNHTILACHFRRPVPRWADEGAASLIEHASERDKQQQLVNQLMHTGRRIPLRILLDMTEYPTDMQQVLALYAEGYSLTQYLVQSQGRDAFLRFLNDANSRGWDAAIKSFYARGNIEALERDWSAWVIAGSPSVRSPEVQTLAQQQPVPSRNSKVADTRVVRSQNPEDANPLRTLRRSVREAQPLPDAEKLTAPDPRSQAPRPLALQPLVEKTPSPKKTVAPLQPLELVRLPDAVITSGDSKVGSNRGMTMSPTPPRPAPSPSAREMYQETRLRTDRQPVARTSERDPDWAQFPSKTR